MKDGKKPGDPGSAYNYDVQTFWKNRDPRFDATIVWNGAVYELSGQKIAVNIRWQASPNPWMLLVMLFRESIITGQVYIAERGSWRNYLLLRLH